MKTFIKIALALFFTFLFHMMYAQKANINTKTKVYNHVKEYTVYYISEETELPRLRVVYNGQIYTFQLDPNHVWIHNKFDDNTILKIQYVGPDIKEIGTVKPFIRGIYWNKYKVL